VSLTNLEGHFEPRPARLAEPRHAFAHEIDREAVAPRRGGSPHRNRHVGGFTGADRARQPGPLAVECHDASVVVEPVVAREGAGLAIAGPVAPSFIGELDRSHHQLPGRSFPWSAVIAVANVIRACHNWLTGGRLD